MTSGTNSGFGGPAPGPGPGGPVPNGPGAYGPSPYGSGPVGPAPGGPAPGGPVPGGPVPGGPGAAGNLGRPRYTTRRLLCGIWWALGTAICGISSFISLFGGHFLQFLGAALITALIGWYDYRIWTFKAKWLMFLIIF